MHRTKDKVTERCNSKIGPTGYQRRCFWREIQPILRTVAARFRISVFRNYSGIRFCKRDETPIEVLKNFEIDADVPIITTTTTTTLTTTKTKTKVTKSSKIATKPNTAKPDIVQDFVPTINFSSSEVCSVYNFNCK